MISTKINLMLLTAITLSTSTIVAMKNEYTKKSTSIGQQLSPAKFEPFNYQVTVHNELVKSAITFSFPSQYSNGGHGLVEPCHKINIAQNNQATLLIPVIYRSIKNIPCKILLPHCYKPSSFEVNINQDKEIIRITSRHPKERNISISHNNKELTRIESSMSPGTYWIAKKLVLEELESQK